MASPSSRTFFSCTPTFVHSNTKQVGGHWGREGTGIDVCFGKGGARDSNTSPFQASFTSTSWRINLPRKLTTDLNGSNLPEANKVVASLI